MITSTLFDLFCTPEKASLEMGSKELKIQATNGALICMIAAEALKNFQQGNLKRFDALVGEEACQFRACKIADLYTQMNGSEPFRKNIAQTIEKAEAMLDYIRENFFQLDKKPGKISPNQFFGKQPLGVNEDIRFIVLSYLLESIKKTEASTLNFYDYKEKSCFVEKLKSKVEQLQLEKVSNGQLVTIGENAQVQLSALSSRYAINCNRGEENLGIKLDERGRSCVSFFNGVQVMLNSMLQKNQKLLVKVTLGNSKEKSCGSVQMLFSPNQARTGFEPCTLSNSSESGNSPLVVFKGNSINEQYNEDNREAYERQFKANDLSELILMNAANHTQYPGEIYLPNIEIITNYADRAEEEGCSRNNMSKFLIDHVFASTIREMNQ